RGQGEEVLASVNSMGGTPVAELYVVFRRLAQLLDEGGVRITRNLVGPFITSLEMQGCSITLLRLDAEKTRLWDAPVHTAGLRWGVRPSTAARTKGVVARCPPASRPARGCGRPRR